MEYVYAASSMLRCEQLTVTIVLQNGQSLHQGQKHLEGDVYG